MLRTDTTLGVRFFGWFQTSFCLVISNFGLQGSNVTGDVFQEGGSTINYINYKVGVSTCCKSSSNP